MSQSGLLAAVAAQLYGISRGDRKYNADGKANSFDLVILLCYCSMLFNIGATVSGFSIIYALGQIDCYHPTLVMFNAALRTSAGMMRLRQGYDLDMLPGLLPPAMSMGSESSQEDQRSVTVA